MPFFDWLFVYPLKENGFGFESDQYIANIHIPILILHAIDDPVVPYFLGKKVNNSNLYYMELDHSLPAWVPACVPV
jgi:abhydrolase domain-containing protein 12